MKDFAGRLQFIGIFSLLYFLLFYFVVGWRVDHTYFLLLVGGLSAIHRYGYYAVLALTGVIAWTILYDAMTFLPNYEVNKVHIKDLYDLELTLFGVMEDGRCISLCEWFESRTTTFLSLFCGTSYLLWIPAPMAFCLYIVWRDKSKVVYFAYAYLLTNVIGIIVYYLFPAAPPWYYLNHGAVFDSSVIGSEALLSEFDRLTGTQIFHGIYTKGTNVFGAIPSLHAAYPLLCLLYAWRFRYRGFMIFFAIMSVGTWIGAVYSQHHYVIDVVLGILCAILSYFLMTWIEKTRYFKNLKAWYEVQLSA